MFAKSHPSFPDSSRFLPSPTADFADPEVKYEDENSALHSENTQIGHGSMNQSNEKSIYLASASSSAAYLPIPVSNNRGKRETTDTVFTKLQKFHVEELAPQNNTNTETRAMSGLALVSKLPQPSNSESDSSLDISKNEVHNSSFPAEIPVYEIDSLPYKDPVSLVEALAAEGKRYGAIKIKMNDAFIKEQGCRLNPDSFTFKANRLVNNPRQNELYSRLRFYNELIRFHTRDIKDPSTSSRSRSTTPQKDAENGANGSLTTNSSNENASVNNGLANLHENPANEQMAEKNEIFEEDKKTCISTENYGDTEPTKTDSQRIKLPAFLTKLPMMDKRPLDLFDLFRFVLRKGGYVEVINRKLWAQIGRELGYKGKITSSLSSSLKVCYAKILYPLELHLQENGLDLTGEGEVAKNSGGYDGAVAEVNLVNNGVSQVSGYKHNGDLKRTNESNEGGDIKKRKLNSSAPLILGSAAEIRRSIRLKASKGFLINDPHLIDLKTPLVIAMKDQIQDPESKIKSEILVSPTGSAAQINNYLKWLATHSSFFQDSTRLEVSSKLATTCTLRQFLEKDSKFQEYLMHKYKNIFSKGTRDNKSVDLVNKLEGMLSMSSSDMEEIFWKFLYDCPAEYSRLENCPKIPGFLADGGVHYVGEDFSNKKVHVYAGSGLLATGQNSSPFPITKDENGDIVKEPSQEDVSRNMKAISKSLNPFELFNIPYLPDSLLGAFAASDLANDDLINPSLNIGMTFSTENWRCEDHFTQLGNYHSFGKSKRWYFIPESEFEKFEELVRETIAKQNNKAPRVNKNYHSSCWDVDSLANFVTTDEEVTSTQYECLFNSLENIVSPYPETRAKNDNPVFQKLIDLQQKDTTYNQEYFITPEMLKEHGIKFTTTLQSPGEFIYKYPKTYSSSISFGFNVSEEINFASKLWLDYGVDGEKWLQKQGIPPSISTFKLLTNFAQILESSNGNNNHFSPAVHSKVSETFSKLLEEELALRNSVRNKVKVEESTIEERHMVGSDVVTDDDLSSAIPSKIVIHSNATHSSFAMSLKNFNSLLENDGATTISNDLTFAGLLKHSEFYIELLLYYSDEKLRSFQRSLNGFSVDFEAWLSKYDDLMNSEEEMILKNYKALLHDGQKILSALSGAPNTFENFCSEKTLDSNTCSQVIKIENFKKQLDNLREFVDESSVIVDQCHAILSLKHQQRIRNGGTDNTEHNEDEHPESLQLLVELANKIPHLNFHTPEFDLVLEYKIEIQNFDNACRSLIESGNTAISEISDMINLGTSFGIQIPSLKFLIRLKGRLQWIETHDIIVSGGDPFLGKKEIFSLPDLKKFRDRGFEVLSNGDVDKLKTVDEYLRVGQEYDASINVFLSQKKFLNVVDIRELDSKIFDMEERSKMKGKDRLFVELSTYQKLVDLRAQEKHITFLREFPYNTHSLHGIRQSLLELEGCTYLYDTNHIKGKVEQTEAWLKKVEQILAQVKVVQRDGISHTPTKNICSVTVARRGKLLSEKLQKSLGDDIVDEFESSSPFLFVQDLQDANEEQSPIRYCLCRDYEDGTMIECDTCHEWFHVTCIKDISEIGEDEDSYICPCCQVLSSYQKTSLDPEFSGKIKDVVLLGLIQEGEALQIKPVVELNLLKDLWTTTEEAQLWFSQPAMRTRLEDHDTLYQMFLLRKFVGSPILIRSVVMFLLNSLKFTDLNSAFEQKPKQQIKEAEVNGIPETTTNVEEPSKEQIGEDLKSMPGLATQGSGKSHASIETESQVGQANPMVDPNATNSGGVDRGMSDVSQAGSGALTESSGIAYTSDVPVISSSQNDEKPGLPLPTGSQTIPGETTIVESQTAMDNTPLTAAVPAPTESTEVTKTEPASQNIDPSLMETQ